MSLLVATAPTAPRSPVAKPGNRSVKLTWLAPASNGGAAIDKYVVQRSRNKTTWTKIATTTGRRYTAKRLTNGTKYYFRVRAHNGAGFGPYSTTVKAVPRTRPTAPTSPVATPGNKTVKLTWKAPASDGGAAIDKYAVQRYTSTGWKTIAYPTTRSYTATGLTNGTNYSFRIRAHNAAGWGPFSTAVSAVPRTKPSAPRSPAATPGNGTVELTWLAPSSTGGAAIDKYAVQQAMTSTGPWTTIATPTGNDHTASGLTNGTTYYFRILAHNAAGYGAASTVLGSVPFTVPNAPQSLVATPSPSPDAGYGAVTLTWLAPASNGAAIDTYILRYRKLWDPTSPFMSAFQGSNLSATFRWLTPGEQYLFEVVARNAAGVGPAAYVAATAATVPTEPTACSAVQMSDSKTMYVDWGAPTSNGWAPITSYELKLYTYNGNSLVTTATTAGADTNHYMAVPAFGWYWVEIVARNAAGESPNCWVDVNIKDPDLP